ncbi:MAG: ATP-binding protein [Terracidiphilus sp.]|jgi:two-component system sensor histidine kinase KdpD
MEMPIASKWIAPRRTFRFVWQCLIAWTVIALATYCGFELQVNLATISSLYLLVVVATASFGSFWQASLTSLVAVACLDLFFLPPFFRFNIADPQDWVALGTFEATALAISRLSAREIRSAREAALHRTAMEKLYELSRSSLLLDLRQPPGPQLVVLIQRIFSVRAVALFDNYLGRQDRMGDWGEREQDIAQECFLRNTGQDDRATETAQRIVQDPSGSVGALVTRGKLSPLVVDALASLAAIAIDRHQSFEKEEKAEAASKGEQLRAAVMDALGHEFKNPLATVQTASSGLLEMGGLTATQSELAKLIEEESVRLNELCTRLLLTAKLEAEQVGLKTDRVNVSDLIDEVLASRAAGEIRDRIQIAVEDPALSFWVDRGLIAMVLSQYVDNARKYSTHSSPIRIAAQSSQDEVVISVHNIGSTVRNEDQERIFDRFYRAADLKSSVPGTGIGLSVARKAAEAHHGRVWVESDEEEGTTFFLSLPMGARRRH